MTQSRFDPCYDLQRSPHQAHCPARAEGRKNALNQILVTCYYKTLEHVLTRSQVLYGGPACPKDLHPVKIGDPIEPVHHTRYQIPDTRNQHAAAAANDTYAFSRPSLLASALRPSNGHILPAALRRKHTYYVPFLPPPSSLFQARPQLTHRSIVARPVTRRPLIECAITIENHHRLHLPHPISQRPQQPPRRLPLQLRRQTVKTSSTA